jgi:hypothetical protein
MKKTGPLKLLLFIWKSAVSKVSVLKGNSIQQNRNITFLTVLFCLTCTLGIAQEKIFIWNTNSEDIVKVRINFDENWKFLWLEYPDNSGKRIREGSIYNPITEDNSIESRFSKKVFNRIAYLSVQDLDDYLNGKKIFPLNNCEYEDKWLLADAWNNESKWDNTSKIIKQSVSSRIYFMMIKPDLSDLTQGEGHCVYFDQSGEITKEYFCRYFENGNNFIKIIREPSTEGSTHVWTYNLYTKSKEDKYDHIFSCYISREFCTYYFYNHKSKKQLLFMVAPDYVYKNMGFENNTVYEMNLTQMAEYWTKTNQTKHDFFRSLFSDYPNMKFRLLTDAYKLPLNTEEGVDNEKVNNFMNQFGYSFNQAIDLLIYEGLIKTYCNDKRNPFKGYKESPEGLIRMICD